MAKDLELFDNKLIILYILQNSNKPLTINQIVKFCDEFEDITYIDICIYIDSLKSSNYIAEKIENSTVYYYPTELGISTLNELLELIPGVDIHNLKKMINKNVVEIKTEYSINTNIIPIKSDEYKISCYIKDGNDELINISMYAGTKEQAKNISRNWSQNADNIYLKLLEMMTKEEKNDEENEIN